ncbi:MAG: peptidoglycan DD-metalloendopeptidase family protein [Candidatus Aminicenantes bacterium]|nr:peptidoglycan DD-metalloendopeptidase family protein [Candidatus Aminicenantes bacterium]
MKKTILLIGLLVLPISAVQDVPKPEPPPFKATLEYRALQPGEVVRVSLQSHLDIRQAHVRFLEKKYPLWQTSDPHKFMTFIGLDLNMQPGDYPLSVSVLFEDGALHSSNKEIQVLVKEFPVKKLWVEEKFVTPPAEVLERIRTESALLGSIFSISTPRWLGDGSFIIPSPGKAAPNFGERRYFNDQPRSPHTGVDISSPLGAPVKASNGGQVVLADDLYYAGNTVIIDHGLGMFSFYCHFSVIHAKRGDRVQKGDIIGEVGATGRVTGPHLHWSIRVRNSRIDPFSLLALDLSK